ncbi:MAG: YkoF family thiamine/hydroxymethylpyrimidine-binding protein [Planctomycetota bacterium]
MNVQAELSLYPLRTRQIGHAIDEFLGELGVTGLMVQRGSMSSIVTGAADSIFTATAAAFEAAARKNQVVLVMKVSNACPTGRVAVEARGLQDKE